MNLTDELMSSTPSELKDMQDIFQSVSTMALVFAAIAALLLIVWFIRRKQKATQNSIPKVYIQRTAFAGDIFGVVYEADADQLDTGRYALICDGKGTELCRYEEAEGQTIRGFSSENGTLYMHTYETYDDGSCLPVKWMFISEHNELIECE